MESYMIAVDENNSAYIAHAFWRRKGWEKKKHKYILKIGEGSKARYFYTKAEVDAYYKSLNGHIEKKDNGSNKSSNYYKAKADKGSNTFNGLVNNIKDKIGVDERERFLIAKQKYKALDKKIKEDYEKYRGEVERVYNNENSKLDWMNSSNNIAVLKEQYDKDLQLKSDEVTNYLIAKNDYYGSFLGKYDSVKDWVANKFDKISLTKIKSGKLKSLPLDLTRVYNAYISSDPQFRAIIDTLRQTDVEFKSVDPSRVSRSSDEIINDIGQYDDTVGSCVSVAMAYVGGLAGYDVHDFRGGNSQDFFCHNENIRAIASLEGVDATIINSRYGSSDTKDALDILENVVEGKPYFFAAGSHAAIVRKENGLYQYLELQSGYECGWNRLDNYSLEHRFLCRNDTNRNIISLIKKDNLRYTILIDTSSLVQNEQFISLLGYINTSNDKKRK